MKKQAVNPYLPSWEYIPDGEPYVFDGRVYIYGSHDLYNGHVFCLGGRWRGRCRRPYWSIKKQPLIPHGTRAALLRYHPN